LKGRYVAAARLYADAFRVDAALANDFGKLRRYNAACSAARAAAGQDVEAGRIDAPERARLRRLALGWLRQDLSAWQKLLDGANPADRTLVADRMGGWQHDPDLAGLRDPGALAKLPEAERADWQKLWQDVDALRKRAAEPK
jgi:hypothetical protein